MPGIVSDRRFRSFAPTQFVPSDLAVRMWYFTRVFNIGDRVAPHIVSHLANSQTKLSTAGEHLFAIGSILPGATGQTVVWGTGLMDGAQDVSRVVGSNVYALRGKCTLAALRKTGVKIGDVPLGDPGVLIPQLFPFSGTPRKRLGLIPHYVDRRHPFVRLLSREEGVINLSVHASPAEFFADLRIVRCGRQLKPAWADFCGSARHSESLDQAFGSRGRQRL